MRNFINSNRQRGATLFVGLMFLLVLTLVAIVAMRGTTLELKMATNQSQRQTAFQLSESMRSMAVAITTANQQSRGMQNFSGNAQSWANMGDATHPVGGEPGGGTTCSSAQLQTNLQLFQSESATSYSTTWHTIPGVFRGNVPTASATDIAGNPNKLLANCTVPTGGAAWANVYAIGTRNSTGAGSAANESAPGVGLPGGGATRWYEVRSQAQIGNGAAVVTAGELRETINN